MIKDLIWEVENREKLQSYLIGNLENVNFLVSGKSLGSISTTNFKILQGPLFSLFQISEGIGHCYCQCYLSHWLININY